MTGTDNHHRSNGFIAQALLMETDDTPLDVDVDTTLPSAKSSTMIPKPHPTFDHDANELESMILITIRNEPTPRKTRKSIIAVPLEGMTLFTLANITNAYPDPWNAIINDNRMRLLRPLTLPTLIKDIEMTPDVWAEEERQIDRMLTSYGDATHIDDCIILVTREDDGSIWTLRMPLTDMDDARAIAGLEAEDPYHKTDTGTGA